MKAGFIHFWASYHCGFHPGPSLVPGHSFPTCPVTFPTCIFFCLYFAHFCGSHHSMLIPPWLFSSFPISSEDLPLILSCSQHLNPGCCLKRKHPATELHPWPKELNFPTDLFCEHFTSSNLAYALLPFCPLFMFCSCYVWQSVFRLFPQGSCVEGLVSGTVGWDMEPGWRKVTGGTLEGPHRTLAPSSLSPWLPWAISSGPRPSTMTLCLASGAKRNQSTLDCSLWNHEPKEIFLLVSFFQVFCHSDEKLTHRVSFLWKHLLCPSFP